MYNSYGTTLDWAKSEAGIKWTFLLELPPTHKQASFLKKHEHGFLLPSTRIIPVAHSVFEGFKAVASEIFNTIYP